MFLTGTLLNVATVLVGTLIGVLVGARMPARMQESLISGLGVAKQLAAERGHDYVGTEHVLLALLDDEEGIAGGVIRRLEFNETIREEVEEIMRSTGYATTTLNRRRPPSPGR